MFATLAKVCSHRTRALAIFAMACCLGVGFPHTGEAQDELTVCNKGNRELSVAVLAVVRYAFKPSQGKLRSWYNISPGYCQRVFLLEEDYSSATANVGFVQERADGQVGPRLVTFGGPPWPDVEHRVERFCVHPDGESWESAANDVIQRFSPPCGSEQWEVETSAPVYMGERDVTLDVGPLDEGFPGAPLTPGVPSTPRVPQQPVRVELPVGPHEILNGACLESYALSRPGNDMSRWCGCVAGNLAGVLSMDERQRFMEDPVVFIVRGLDELMPNGQRNWRLYTPLAACQR